jgi:hypothetical protein
MNQYAPFDSVLDSFVCKASKAMTRADFRTYFIMNLPLERFMPS